MCVEMTPDPRRLRNPLKPKRYPATRAIAVDG